MRHRAAQDCILIGYRTMKNILRIVVDSSSIRSIGYDRSDRLLDIEYPSGDVYRYFEVPAWEYENFMKAESKGTYLNREFKSAGYEYVKLAPPNRRAS